MKKFEGMVAAMATPMKPDESLDFKAISKLIKHLIAKGLDGVLVGGTTGEYNMMSFDERKELFQCAVDAAKGTGGYVIAGASCHRLKDTLALAKYAGDIGTDYVLVLPPYYLPTTKQGVYDYFKAISECTKAGVIIYHYPAAINVLLEPEFLAELGRIDNIIGVKNTADMEHTAKLIALNNHYEGFKICNGYEHLFLPTLACGGDACMGIIQNLVPGQMAEMYALAKKNDFAAAAKINERLIPLYNVMETADEPCPGPVKYGLELQGFSAGLPRKPVVGVSEDMKVKLEQVMRQAGAL
jgi:4-hydroxy-tetrahydrodipicolinate synthase